MVSNVDEVVLADRLRLAIGRLARRLRQHSVGGLTPSQRSVLATLDRHGPMTMSRLAEIETISAPSVTGIISRLAEKELVERRPNPEDGRSAIVALTAAGREMLEAGRRERTAYLLEHITRLSEEDRRIVAQAIEILDRLQEEI
ncbi:MAG TPA: MarR family transcriptional regulator [Acidimicrobiia bacterium]|jgi:DNA-binding MarR family transcriptional regulator|nr:MarR family transcriptional regulator [Acidimicrobiia bacterium]